MKVKKTVTKIMCLAMTAISGAVLMGCAGKVAPTPYFAKGVYVNYAEEAENPTKDYYYVFYDEGSGRTDDGSVGIGLPFSCEQTDGTVTFSFGGEDEEKAVLTVDSVDKGTVTGHFDDGLKLVFAPVADVDPETFDAQNYMNAAAGKDLVYHDANGWSVRYDPDLFTVNGGGPLVTFVYTAESAGTNMITASYNVDKDAKSAINDLAKEWGDKTEVYEGVFPGTDDVTGYWANLAPEKDSSGLYSTAVAVDYMDGYLMFELTGHNSGNDEADMAVSDALAGVIDSLEFTKYDN